MIETIYTLVSIAALLYFCYGTWRIVCILKKILSSFESIEVTTDVLREDVQAIKQRLGADK